MAADVIREAKKFCHGWEPLMAALEPKVGPVSQDTLENWVAGRRSARADAVLAAADIASIDLTERLGAKSIRQELASLKAEIAALRSQHEANAS